MCTQSYHEMQVLPTAQLADMATRLALGGAARLCGSHNAVGQAKTQHAIVASMCDSFPLSSYT
jgi:hypothetical protein